MAEVIWSRDALANLDLIAEYIARSDPGAAQRMIGRLLAAGDSLARFPSRGRPAPKGRREFARLAPYIIVYRVVGDQVLIIRVRHSARAT